MYCSKCGTLLDPNAAACPSCYHPAEKLTPPAPVVVTDWKNSFFDGGFWGLLGINLLSGLLTVISFGFAWPAVYCMRLRWIYSHTCVGGYRLKFNGRGGQLFGKYILWTFLSIITFGIYALWLPIKYKRWETKHVEIDSQIPIK